ncbi:bacitracin ABC transporter ATP-binding protein [Flavihumibacter stibioxidans]|uniref:Bacitracin ABC transporter ATP-binding protein n=2 Tax=Flavihumibacter stibioxidans TaxID=1834163 RepID=A0ABR7M7K5_9BACT|nr:bacitracin ABC transporter ATP-binding protein [Flavihumibacter stibioxidans]
MTPLIEVKNLVKRFDDLVAVDDLSFTVYPADVYGFLGQNGAGKSTSIRMLLSLIKPTSGEISLFGMDLQKHRFEILRRVGAVIERPDLYKYLSAIDNLSIFARMSGIRPGRKQLMEQLEMVGLAERADGKVRTYSQGMKQRLGIAVALVHDPDLVILDEPTNGLDPQGIADMRNLILRLSREMGKTVLVSSHLLSEIEQVATRMIIIDKGRKMVEGGVAELFKPSNSRIHIKVEQPGRAWQLLQQSEWKPFMEQGPDGELIVIMSPDKVPALASELVQQGVGLLSIRSANSLEEYFLSLTSGKQHVASFKH